MSKVLLLDMDGTLTEPRGHMSMNMSSQLGLLQKKGFRIGIVSGSDMNYIREQCNILWGLSILNYMQVDYFPCNGTKHLAYDKYGKLHTMHEVSMLNKLGIEHFNHIIYFLFEEQRRMLYTLWGKKLPMTGNFIDCRGSMINWCPIGRNAGKKERKIWKTLDKKYNIRKTILEKLLSHPTMAGVTIKLGGETSFDIYPKGWDKTYVLKHLEEDAEIYFIGDKCGEGGNDKELYDALNAQKAGSAFVTTGPSKTIDIINSSILYDVT